LLCVGATSNSTPSFKDFAHNRDLSKPSLTQIHTSPAPHRTPCGTASKEGPGTKEKNTEGLLLIPDKQNKQTKPNDLQHGMG
jgi:hypothetical protein